MNAAVQRAALVAVTTPTDFPEQMRREYQTRRQLTLDRLAGVPGISLQPPDGTFYVFVRSDRGISADAMAAAAREHGVAVRSGTEYGPSGEHHIRLAFSSSREDLAAGLDRLAAMFADLAAAPGVTQTSLATAG
jgi:aspartate aminotransferase